MSRDVTVTFDDGTSHTYRGVPDEATPDQVQARAQADFGKGVSALDGGLGSQQSLPPATGRDRYLALNAGVARGVAGVAGLPVDTVANVIDLGKAGIGSLYSRFTGRAPPAALEVDDDRSRMWGSSQNIAALMSRGGVRTDPARPDDAASRYLFAAGTALPASAGLRPGSVAEAGLRMGQAAGIGVVPQAVQDAGGSSTAGQAATLAASVLVPATVGSARAVAAGIQPLREAGRRQVAGAALRSAAQNPEKAIRNMESATPLVPGSSPTAGQAARDPGIAYFENRLRGLNGSSFSQRQSQQNEARQRLLDTVAKGGSDPAIAALEARREGVTTALRDRAFQQASGKPTPTQQIVSDIDSMLANPENAGRSVQQALKAVRDQMFDGEGNLLTDARALYAVRKEINRVLEGKYVDSNESVLRYAGGQLKGVRESIDSAIAEVAPDWKQYLTKYSQLSRPIERAQKIGEIRKMTRLAAPDIETGRDYLSQPKWRNVVGDNLKELSQVLTKGQMQKMQMVAADLDRGAAATNSSSIRVPGSDTAANLTVQGQLSVANIIGRTLGRNVKDLPPALGTAMRPLAWVYKLPDDQIRSLIVDAMLDPKLAAQLMREGTRENVQALADSFRHQAELSGIIVSADDR